VVVTTACKQKIHVQLEYTMHPTNLPLNNTATLTDHQPATSLYGAKLTQNASWSQRGCKQWTASKTSLIIWRLVRGTGNKGTAQGFFWMRMASLDCLAVMEPVGRERKRERAARKDMQQLQAAEVQRVCVGCFQQDSGRVTALADTAAAIGDGRLLALCMMDREPDTHA
jgi:hypothetical protein